MSNETPKPNHAKTKSAPKLLRYGLVGLALAALILPFFFVGRPTTTLVSGGREYRLEIVSTSASQEKGLGGRQNMAADRGMIFVFDSPETQCMWMKDMQLSLDIIWLNSAKQVTKVAENVSPSTYPEKYCSDDATKYVIELNAGEAKKAGIAVGATLKL
jgi:uncharacterized membrane protein (UPF0127 family)